MVWHNNTLLDPRYRSLYLKLLKTIEGAGQFDWKSEFSAALGNAPWKSTCVIGS